MTSGQDLLQKVQVEFHNSGGNLSLTLEEFCDYFILETSVAEAVITGLCATGCDIIV